MKKVISKYDEKLLNETLLRDEANLIGIYDKITGETRINFICKCGLEYTKIFRNAFIESKFVCLKCTKINTREKAKATNIKKYGFENPTQNKDVKEKIVATNIKNYGVNCVFKAEVIKDKIKEINLEIYGVENPSQNQEIKEKKIQTTLKNYNVENPKQSEEIKEKAKQTCLKNHGVEFAMQSEIIQEQTKQTNLEKHGVACSANSEQSKVKAKQTCLKNYGVEHSSKSNEVKEKIKKTNLKIYGFEYSSQNEKTREKAKQTCLKRYGTEYPMQNQEFMEKVQKNAKKYKEYRMPNGTIRKIQGYEPFALDILLKEFNEEQIITERKQIPTIHYLDNDKKRYYFPDIFLLHLNKIIEVKSTWTYKCKKDNVFEKEKATKEQGYDYEFWVFDNKGRKISEEELLFI